MKKMMLGIFLLVTSIWFLVLAAANTLNEELWGMISIILLIISCCCFYKGYSGKKRK